jgi:ABC-type transporter Mla MlaB component
MVEPERLVLAGAHARAALGIEARRSRAEWRLVLTGELTRRTADPLADVLEAALEAQAERIVLDLSALERIDHVGVHTILLAHLRSSDQQHALLIVPGPGAVQGMFDAVEGPFDYVDLLGR